MAAAPKINLGKIPCPCCGDPVALKQSATGKLSYQCQHADCESTGFADQHSGAARAWMAKLPQAASAPAKSAPGAAPAAPLTPTPPPPQKAAPKGGFSLGDLK